MILDLLLKYSRAIAFSQHYVMLHSRFGCSHILVHAPPSPHHV